MSRSPKPAGQRHAGSKGRRKPAQKKPPTVQRRDVPPAPPRVAGQVSSRQRPLISPQEARAIELAESRRKATEALMRRDPTGGRR